MTKLEKAYVAGLFVGATIGFVLTRMYMHYFH